jgi:hypothetical protein
MQTETPRRALDRPRDASPWKPMLDKDCRPDTLATLSNRLERAAP